MSYLWKEDAEEESAWTIVQRNGWVADMWSPGTLSAGRERVARVCGVGRADRGVGSKAWSFPHTGHHKVFFRQADLAHRVGPARATHIIHGLLQRPEKARLCTSHSSKLIMNQLPNTNHLSTDRAHTQSASLKIRHLLQVTISSLSVVLQQSFAMPTNLVCIALHLCHCYCY